MSTKLQIKVEESFSGSSWGTMVEHDKINFGRSQKGQDNRSTRQYMNRQTPDYKAIVEALNWDVKMWRHIILYTGNEGAEEPVAFISSYSRMSRQKMLSKRRYSP